MKKETVLKTYKDDTTKVSEISRSLALAGIAVIWIFNKTVKDSHSIPDSLILPAILFIFALLCDLFQYLYSGFAYYWLYHHGKTETNNQANDPNKTDDIINDGKNIKIKKPKFINIPKWLFYDLKVVSLFIGYFFLLGYLRWLFIHNK